MTPELRVLTVCIWRHAQRYWAGWAGPINPIPSVLMPRVALVHVPYAQNGWDFGRDHLVPWLTNDYSHMSQYWTPEKPAYHVPRLA